jgi:hypothetical protein
MHCLASAQAVLGTRLVAVRLTHWPSADQADPDTQSSCCQLPTKWWYGSLSRLAIRWGWLNSPCRQASTRQMTSGCTSARASSKAACRVSNQARTVPVHTEEVTGSIPVSPTQLSGQLRFCNWPFLILRQQQTAAAIMRASRRACGAPHGWHPTVLPIPLRNTSAGRSSALSLSEHAVGRPHPITIRPAASSAGRLGTKRNMKHHSKFHTERWSQAVVITTQGLLGVSSQLPEYGAVFAQSSRELKVPRHEQGTFTGYGLFWALGSGEPAGSWSSAVPCRSWRALSA